MTIDTANGFLTSVWRARHLFTAVPIFAISTGALYPLIALELSSRGHENAVIGLMTSAWYFGAFLGTALGGRVIVRLGYHKAFTFSAFLAAFSVWGLTLFESPTAWVFLRLLGGFGLGSYYLLMESWVSGLATPATRGRMIAIYEALRIGAVAFGPILLIIVSSHAAFVLFGAFFVFAVVPVTLAKPPTASFNATGWWQALVIFVCSPCSVALTIIAGLLSSSFYGFGAIYAEGVGFSKVEIALFMSVILLAPAISQLPIGTLADLYGRARTSLWASFLALIFALILALQPSSSFIAALAAAAIVTGLVHPLYALAHGRLVDGGHDLVAATIAGLIGYNIGTFLGPFGAALAMDHSGATGLYVWVSICLICAIYVAMLATVHARPRCCLL